MPIGYTSGNTARTAPPQKTKKGPAPISSLGSSFKRSPYVREQHTPPCGAVRVEPYPTGCVRSVLPPCTILVSIVSNIGVLCS
jgi:hypothetical protein